jgi:2-hydroxy-6-oxonona-2,4-dienedioate hydrolase
MLQRRGTRMLVLALAVLAIGIAVVVSRYRHDFSQARARIATSSIAQTVCGPVEYVSAGSGTPVLVVHGAGGGFDQGMDFGGDLVAHGFE